jgi:hypothetical protein
MLPLAASTYQESRSMYFKIQFKLCADRDVRVEYGMAALANRKFVGMRHNSSSTHSKPSRSESPVRAYNDVLCLVWAYWRAFADKLVARVRPTLRCVSLLHNANLLLLTLP